MKKFQVIPLLLVLLLSAVAVACADEPTPVPPTATPPAAVDPTPTPAEPTATPEPEATPTPEATPEPTPTSTPDPPAASLQVTSHSELGNILTDAEGLTLYLFTRDQRNVSNCSGNCANRWPPLAVEGDPVASEGVTADLLGAITREDGSSQVTYNGWPLYYFEDDQDPGDATGQDVGNVWFVVSPYGGPIQTNAAVQVSPHTELGEILTDASGRVLYLFTRDEPNVSNCADGCARRWPPLLTVDDPAAGDGVDADLLGTTTRNDGSTQVTYNGHPLYYYEADTGPGQAVGQNVGEVWFVVSLEGDAIAPAPPATGVDAIAGTPPANVLSIILVEENDSGQTGWAALIARGDQTEVILSLPEGAMDTAAAHIHTGRCGPDLGGVAYPLTSFEGGSGYSVTTVDADLASLRSGDFAINTHNAEDSSIYTSCGNIPTAEQSVTITLEEENDSGQSGIATLTARGTQTDVVLHLSPGEMESERVHIHSGQCGPDLGGVVHPLTDFVDGAGASITTIDVTLDSLLTGDFAINTHQLGNPSTYTSCGNIPHQDELARGEPVTVASDIASFALEDLAIAVGTTVTWTNRDAAPHTVTSGTSSMADGRWDSPSLGQGNSYSFTFNQPGQFAYFCAIHPSMTATVTVAEGAAPQAAAGSAEYDY